MSIDEGGRRDIRGGRQPVVAQLLFWRLVPGYQPFAEAFATARQITDLLRGALADAAARGQVHADAATDVGMDLLSTMHFGIISRHLASDPGTAGPAGAGRAKTVRVRAAKPAPP